MKKPGDFLLKVDYSNLPNPLKEEISKIISIEPEFLQGKNLFEISELLQKRMKNQKTKKMANQTKKIIMQCASFAENAGLKSGKAFSEKKTEKTAQFQRYFGENLDSKTELLAHEILEKVKILRNFDQAIQTAEKIKDNNFKSPAYAKIATELAKAGLFDQAEKAFDQAIQTAEKIKDNSSKSEAYADIATELAKAGLFDQAIQTAEKIENNYFKSEAYADIATELAKAGLLDKAEKAFDQAIQTAEKIGNNDYKSEAYKNIATELAKAGLFDQAIQTAKKIEDYYSKSEAYRNIATELAKAGLFDQAIQTAEKIEDYYSKSEAYRDIATELAKASLFDQAIQTAEKIENNGHKSEAYRDIATELAKAGLFDQAIQTAKKIEDYYYKPEAYRNIATELAKAGLFDQAEKAFDQAIQTAEKIKDNSSKSEAYADIATELAKAGLFDQAIQTAEKIEDNDSKSEAYRNIATELAKAGLFDQAEKVFDQAIQTAEKIENNDYKSYAYANIATELAKAGLFDQAEKAFDQAIQTAEKIKDNSSKSEAYANIATELAKLNEGKIAKQFSFEELKEIFDIAVNSKDRKLLESVGLSSSFEQMNQLAETANEEDKAKILRIMADAKLQLHHLFDLNQEEKAFLWKKYSKELRQLMNEQNDDLALKLTTRILYTLDEINDENSGSSLLLDEIKKRESSEPGVARILYVLSKSDSDKAKDFVLKSIGKEGLKGNHCFLLINKLIKNKFLDENLTGFFEENKNKKAISLFAFKLALTELNITPDAELMKYLTNNANDLSAVRNNVESAKKKINEFEQITDKDELVNYLSKNKDNSLLYFILFGGKTRFALVNNYDSTKFATAVGVASKLEIHETPLNEFLDSLPKEIDKTKLKQNLLEGRFPLGNDYSTQLRIDVSDSATLKQIEKRTSQIFGKTELGIFLKIPTYLNLLEKTDQKLCNELSNCNGLADSSNVISKIDEKYPEFSKEIENSLEKDWKKLGEKKVLELSLYSVLTNEENAVSLKKLIPSLENQRKTLMDAVRKQYKSGSIEKLARDERIESLEEKGKAKLMSYLLQEISMAKNREVELKIFSEWESHLDQVFQDFEKIKNSEKTVATEKTVILRYLEKRKDLVECMRFADSASCCFNSKNYRIENHNVGSAEWIIRIWKDPLSFVFQIEDNPGNAIGFVFGSFGIADEKPVILYNGVYIEGKNDTSAQSIMNQLENDFSRPLRMKMQFVAGRHGGSANYGKEYSNKFIEVKRLRALKGQDGNPEKIIYDDINVGVNDIKKTDSNIWHKKL